MKGRGIQKSYQVETSAFFHRRPGFIDGSNYALRRGEGTTRNVLQLSNDFYEGKSFRERE